MEAAVLAQLKKLWDSNEQLWNERINKEILIPLEERGGVTLRDDDEGITATAFGSSMGTFQAVQEICNPREDKHYWSDGFSLTRSLFEAFVTLEWIELGRAVRSSLFRDEYVLKMAHFLRVADKEGTEVRPEKRKEILEWHSEVISRRKCGPDRLSLMPSVEDRVKEIAESPGSEHPNLKWEYDIYYRDVSSFAHPSGWGLWSNLPKGKGPIEMKSSPAIGIKALMCNGGWFLRVMRVWNRVFKIVPPERTKQWEQEWVNHQLFKE